MPSKVLDWGLKVTLDNLVKCRDMKPWTTENSPVCVWTQYHRRFGQNIVDTKIAAMLFRTTVLYLNQALLVPLIKWLNIVERSKLSIFFRVNVYFEGKSCLKIRFWPFLCTIQSFPFEKFSSEPPLTTCDNMNCFF